MSNNLLIKLQELLESKIDGFKSLVQDEQISIGICKYSIGKLENIINKPDSSSINSKTLEDIQEICSIISYPFDDDNYQYTHLLGEYYLHPNDEKIRKKIEIILNPIIELTKSKVKDINYLSDNNNRLKMLYENLNVALKGLIVNNSNETLIPITDTFILKKLINFIELQEFSVEEKLKLIETINELNLEAFHHRKLMLDKERIAKSKKEIKKKILEQKSREEKKVDIEPAAPEEDIEDKSERLSIIDDINSLLTENKFDEENIELETTEWFNFYKEENLSFEEVDDDYRLKVILMSLIDLKKSIMSNSITIENIKESFSSIKESLIIEKERLNSIPLYNEEELKIKEFESQHVEDLEKIDEIINNLEYITNNGDEKLLNLLGSATEMLKVKELSYLSTTDFEIEIAEIFKNLNISMTIDEYVNYRFFTEIKDLFSLYEISDELSEKISWFNEIQSLIENYEIINLGRISLSVNESSNEEKNSVIFLKTDRDQFYSIENILKDSHEYNEREYSDINSSIEMLISLPFQQMRYQTDKIKGSGFDNISENKTRKFRKGNIRTIYIDLKELIKDEYQKYLNNDRHCYVVSLIGLKHEEANLYDLNNGESVRNCFRRLASTVNSGIETIIKTVQSEEDKALKVQEFIIKLSSANFSEWQQIMDQIKNNKHFSLNINGEAL